MTIELRVVCCVALLGASCLDLDLPPTPPPPGPGTLQGSLRYAVSGRQAPLPAPGARIEVLQSSNAVRSDAEGRFQLGGLLSSEGVVRITFDVDGDGRPDRQRLFTLASVGAGPGRDVSLGEVLLGRNARLVGRVLRGDIQGDAFHLGTDVFATGLEFSTFSADNGAFALDGLPEGTLQVSFFRENYRPDSREVTLPGGEEVRLADVLLEASPSSAATATATVRSSAGDALEGARLRAVGFASEGAATSTADGSLTLGPIPSGVYLMSVERAGFVSVALGRRVLAAGANDLGTIVLTSGTSMPVPLDAGGPPPVPDAGPMGGDAGAGDAGRDGGLDGGTGRLDGGAPDAGDGGANVGSPDGGDAGVLDGGRPCEGLCAPGYFCAADDSCRPSSCGAQSCAFCNQGQCFPKDCPGQPCGPGDVCSAGACVPLSCAGVSCAVDTRCAGGTCLPINCSATLPCGAGRVCQFGQCTEERCVGRLCGSGTLCSSGTCWPTGTPGNQCGAGFALINGRCREVACEGITCGLGTQCSNGRCVARGLYVAGTLRPQDNATATNNRYVLGALVDGRWEKIASFPEPVRQLYLSPDGAWMFARTRPFTTGSSTVPTALLRSQDGRVWTTVYSGTDMMNGAIEDLHLDGNTGALTMSVTGFQTNGLHRIMRSTDNGNTWSVVYLSPGSVGVASYAPPDFFTVKNPRALTVEGLYRFHVPALPDGGVRTLLAQPAADPFLVSDPLGYGPTFLAHPTSFTYFLDGGLAGTFSVIPNAAVYGPAPSQQVMLLTTSNVARSFDHGRSWSFRTPPAAAPTFTGLVRGVDDALYLANEDANPPLFRSADDGETWTEVATDEWRLVGLHSWWNEWQPSMTFGVNSEVVPSQGNATGYVYRAIVGGVSAATEPDWTDGGLFVNDGTVRWRQELLLKPMRPSALLSRSCAPGQQRCGAGCVDVSTNPQHCGGCGRTCSASCVAGLCLTPGTMDGGVSVGCADGTREGFVDVTQYPDVAACEGTWTGDLDQSVSAEALCATGWHVCNEVDTEIRALTTAQATAFPGCFAFRASIDGFDGCDQLDCSNDTTRDDVAAVGNSCLALSGVSRLPAQVPDGGACFADRGGIASQCCSVSIPLATRAAGCPQRGESGVVCCR